MSVIWNPLRATIRVLTPKEEKLLMQEQKFKRQVFMRNVTRMKDIVMSLLEVGKYIKKAFKQLEVTGISIVIAHYFRPPFSASAWSGSHRCDR